MTEWLHFHFSLSCFGEGHGSPLQCSCLETPRDRGAWWAAVCGVVQSQIRLKRLSSSNSNHLQLKTRTQFTCPWKEQVSSAPPVCIKQGGEGAGFTGEWTDVASVDGRHIWKQLVTPHERFPTKVLWGSKHHGSPSPANNLIDPADQLWQLALSLSFCLFGEGKTNLGQQT